MGKVKKKKKRNVFEMPFKTAVLEMMDFISLP